MNELMKIGTSPVGDIVSARELHGFLESQRQFTDWFKLLIEKYNLIDGVDYSRLNHNFVINSRIRKRGRPSIDYAITILKAMFIASKSNSAKGDEIAEYLVTKLLPQPVSHYPAKEYSVEELLEMQLNSIREVKETKQALALAEHKVAEKDKVIEKQAPKAEYYDKSISTDGLHSLSAAIKILNPGWKDGRNKFCKLLRLAGVFLQTKNEPRQEYIAKKYFEPKEEIIHHKVKPNRVILVTQVTSLGIKELAKWMNANNFNDEAVVDAFIAKKEEELRQRHAYKFNSNNTSAVRGGE